MQSWVHSVHLLSAALVVASCVGEPRADEEIDRSDRTSMESAEAATDSSSADASAPDSAAAPDSAPDDEVSPLPLGIYRMQDVDDPVRLELRPDRTFVWHLTSGDGAAMGTGRWRVAGDRLALSPPAGVSSFRWISGGGASDALEGQLLIAPEPNSLISLVWFEPSLQRDREQHLWELERRY